VEFIIFETSARVQVQEHAGFQVISHCRTHCAGVSISPATCEIPYKPVIPHTDGDNQPQRPRPYNFCRMPQIHWMLFLAGAARLRKLQHTFTLSSTSPFSSSRSPCVPRHLLFHLGSAGNVFGAQ